MKALILLLLLPSISSACDFENLMLGAERPSKECVYSSGDFSPYEIKFINGKFYTRFYISANAGVQGFIEGKHKLSFPQPLLNLKYIGKLAGPIGDEPLFAVVAPKKEVAKKVVIADEPVEDDNAFPAYVQELPNLIRPNWKSSRVDLRCKVKVINGLAEVVESSGNSEFDASAIEAIKNTTFPKPSDSVKARLSNSGIILSFPL